MYPKRTNTLHMCAGNSRARRPWVLQGCSPSYWEMEYKSWVHNQKIWYIFSWKREFTNYSFWQHDTHKSLSFLQKCTRFQSKGSAITSVKNPSSSSLKKIGNLSWCLTRKIWDLEGLQIILAVLPSPRRWAFLHHPRPGACWETRCSEPKNDSVLDTSTY